MRTKYYPGKSRSGWKALTAVEYAILACALGVGLVAVFGGVGAP
jgi:hypothetical protein